MSILLTCITFFFLQNVQPLLPSVFDEDDAEQIIHNVLKNSQSSQVKDALIIGRSAVTSNTFIQNLKPVFDSMIEEMANEVTGILVSHSSLLILFWINILLRLSLLEHTYKLKPTYGTQK